MSPKFDTDREQTAEGRSSGIAVILGGLLTLYIVGYVLLLIGGYFDLARLPWASHTDNLLDRIYWPIEWVRRLWH
jgi:hypothetical protein